MPGNIALSIFSASSLLSRIRINPPRGPRKRLVRCRRYDIKTCIKWVRKRATCDEPCDVCHIRYCICSNFTRDRDKLFIIKLTCVRREASNNNFRLMLKREFPQFIIINFTCINIPHSVMNKLINF